MLGREMISHLRESVLDDAAIPYQWSDTELLRFLNYAEVQACRRAHLLIDATTATDYGTAATASTNGTAALCRLVLTQDQAVYNLSKKVLQIKRCHISGMAYPLIGPKTYHELNEFVPDWWGTNGTVGTAGSGGYPDYFMVEPTIPNVITFVRAPGTAGTAYMIVSRLPLISFTLNTSPEIDEKYHIDLCDWAAHLAFKKPDSDTYNEKLSKDYEASFTAKFGPLPDAYSDRMKKILSQQGRMRPREYGR